MFPSLESLTEHYVMVARMDKDYAWMRVKAVAKQMPDLYGTLPALLTKAMKELADAQSSTH